jgi:hypothetical protein
VENPGTILVGFETELPADSDGILQVSLIPASSGTVGVFEKNLAEW